MRDSIEYAWYRMAANVAYPRRWFAAVICMAFGIAIVAGADVTSTDTVDRIHGYGHAVSSND